MHILTKILVVLVALLVVALVPLAAVSSTNQLTFKQKASDAESSLKAEQASSKAAQDAWNANMAQLRQRNESLSNQLTSVQTQFDAERQARGSLETRVEGLQLQVAELQGQASGLIASSQAQSKVIEDFNQRIQGAQALALEAEKQKVELQTALSRMQADLDNETQAKRLLQEQLQKVTEEKERTAADLARMAAQFGTSSTSAGAASSATAPIPADRSLSASIISVKREPDCTLAEINAGSRDGVKEGWVMLISDESHNFVGNLRITSVDVNRSVGQVELEDVATRGEVKPSHRAYARKGV